MSWDPGQYLRFTDERLRPALDLLAHIPAAAPARVVDLGCGPGNVTRLLKARWPEADVLGIDGSGDMLGKARIDAPDCRFAEADIAAFRPDAPLDVLYTNAALHWLGDHPRLFPHLLDTVAPGGWFAVQMPAMHAEPFRRLQETVAQAGPWAAKMLDLPSARAILTAGDYYDLLRPQCTSLDIWETTYLHPLQGEDAVVQWAQGSSLRPFLDRLTDPAERDAYRRAYADAVRPHYPRRSDGTTLLPFRRLFIVAQR